MTKTGEWVDLSGDAKARLVPGGTGRVLVIRVKGHPTVALTPAEKKNLAKLLYDEAIEKAMDEVQACPECGRPCQILCDCGGPVCMRADCKPHVHRDRSHDGHLGAVSA